MRCVPTVALGLVLAAQPAYAGVSTTPDVTGQAAGGVYAIADAGDRTIIGGLFTRYGNHARANVAAINADGTVDVAWNPGTNGVVRAVAVSEDGSTVFLGGAFTTVGGQPRANLAAVDAVTGAVLDWTADTGGSAPDVNSLAVKGDRLYVGGKFGAIAGTTRKRLVALESPPATSSRASARAVRLHPGGRGLARRHQGVRRRWVQRHRWADPGARPPSSSRAPAPPRRSTPAGTGATW